MVSVTWGRFVSIALAGFLLAARMEMSLQSSEPQNKRVNVSLDDSQRVCFSLSGQKGSTGPVGPPGKMGLKGRSGPRGISGSKGPRGKKGSKGDSSVSAITELQTRLAAAEKLISDLANVTRDACTQDLEGEVRYEPNLQGLYYCDGDQWRCVSHKLTPCTGVFCGDLTEGDMQYAFTSRTDVVKDYACIVTLIDESGTMSGEQKWLPSALLALEQLLVAAKIGVKRPNQYAYVGFGVPGVSARIVQYQNRDWFSASDLQAAARQLNTDGDTEDGWYAIKFAIDNITLPEDCARNFLLVTDERRVKSPQGRGLTKEFVLQLLRANNITLNVIANIAFSLDRGDDAFGVEYQGLSFGVGRDNYLAYDEPLAVTPGRAFCQSYKDYGELGLKTRGAVWDLETLRQGAVQVAYATAFTNAFTEVMRRDIVSTSVDCNECECVRSGLGETLRCTKSTNLYYCICRATPGETERSCRRVVTGGQTEATRAPLDPSTIVAADCARAGK